MIQTRLTEGLYEFMAEVGLIPGVKMGKAAQPGIMTKAFLAADEEPKSPNDKAVAPPEEEAEEAVRDIIIKNPKINGSTLLNKMKADGITMNKPASIQASDASSTNAPSLRAGIKKQEAKQVNFGIRAHFCESSPKDNGVGFTKFDVILLQEGMGNFRDAYYYTREALESAINLFEGKKIYADHPTALGEEIQPERSVKDILGHFENVRLEENEGRSMLCASVQILPDRPYDWARALMAHSVEYAKKYPDKDFVGLSINASGDAQEMAFDEFLKSVKIPDSAAKKVQDAQADGIPSVRVVSSITDAVSVDLVTEAGAGGRIRSMLEKAKQKESKMKQEENKEKHKEDSVTLNAGPNGPQIKEAEEKHEEALPGQDDKADADKSAEDHHDQSDQADKAGKEEEDAVQGEPASPEHDDEDQDKELIKKMLDLYIGPAEHPEEYMAHAHEALKNAKDAGMDEKEAMKCAGYSMKMAHAMKQNMDKKAAPAPAQKPAAQDDKDPASMQQSSEKKEEESHKESAKNPVKENAKLRGEIAALKEKLSTYETEKHLDKILRESGLKMDVTKKFREACGDTKSIKVIDEKFKLFLEGYKLATGGEASLSVSGFHLGDEKGAAVSDSNESFADCLN